MKVEKLFLVEIEVKDTPDNEEFESEFDLSELDIDEMIKLHFKLRDLSDEIVNINVHDARINDDGQLTYRRVLCE